STSSTGPHWTYEGPHGQHHWAEGHPACGGQSQSPIDITTQWVLPDPSLPPIRPVGYDHPLVPTFSLTNNGHTVVLALPPTLHLEGLPRSFAAAQLHFHWGHSGHPEGAEHLLNGHRAPAEMHVVHYDAERYANASEAQHHAAGLAVLGILLEVGDEPNAAYANILNHLGSVRYAGQTTSIPSFNVQELLPKRLDRYYRYNGSLTTPPCLQSVLWTVFQQPVYISTAQLEQLQGSLYATAADEPSAERLEDNFRDPQDLNQRPVHRHRFWHRPQLPWPLHHCSLCEQTASVRAPPSPPRNPHYQKGGLGGTGIPPKSSRRLSVHPFSCKAAPGGHRSRTSFSRPPPSARLQMRATDPEPGRPPSPQEECGGAQP
uniref:carbonic anhydrase n=1 Tax=Phasianus colchicus TaxID=9054 RepID=A0A669QVW2_PHACC